MCRLQSKWTEIPLLYKSYIYISVIFLLSCYIQLCASVLHFSIHLAERTGSLGCIGWILVILSGILVIILFPITIWFCVKVSEVNNRRAASKRNTKDATSCVTCVGVTCSVVFYLQIVQEYERAVIFRLGRITDRKAKGPGIHADL